MMSNLLKSNRKPLLNGAIEIIKTNDENIRII